MSGYEPWPSESEVIAAQNAQRVAHDKFKDTLAMIADARFSDEGAKQGLNWCQSLARAILKS